MTKRIRDTDYLAVSARVRSMENGLLTRAKMEQVLDAPTDREAVRLLREWGYGELDAARPERMNAGLSSAWKTLLDDLSDSVPDPRCIEVFRLPCDYHNLKVALKADAMGIDGERLTERCGRVKYKTITDAVKTGENRSLPPYLAEAAREAKEILDTARDPQLCEIAVDRRYFRELSDLAGTVGNPYLQGYAAALIDAANLRALVRVLRMGREPSFLRRVLAEGGEIPAEPLRKVAEDHGAGLAEVYAATRFHVAAEQGAQALRGGELAEFEKLCEDAVADTLSDAAFMPFGEAPLIRFLAAKAAEIVNLRILLLGRRAGVSTEMIRSRLRLGYL